MSTTHQQTITTLSVQGMTCGSCEQRVRRALEAIPGVEGAEVSRGAPRPGSATTPEW